MPVVNRTLLASAAAAAAAAVTATAAVPAAQATARTPFIGQFHKITTIASTVPHNGDVNPYGVVVLKRSLGRLVKGDVLISNFNNAKNLQGTGTTLVEISPGGKLTQFARIKATKLPGPCPGGVGLTTALAVLRDGWVVVGSLPTANGMAATAKAGCLIVLDSRGRVRETISGHGINGPWDMTATQRGTMASLFVSNVLNGTVAAGGATVHRGQIRRLTLKLRGSMPPKLMATVKVGSGFGEHSDPAALVVGPTGLGLSHGTLYVADSVGNRVTAIAHAVTRSGSAGTGRVVTRNGALSTPLGLTMAPNGDVLTVNGGNGKIVETTPAGRQAAVKSLDRSGSPPGAGALFGLGVAPHHSGVYYVDDAVNTLRLLH
jgi:sugar lactone lactonase YvrE